MNIVFSLSPLSLLPSLFLSPSLSLSHSLSLFFSDQNSHAIALLLTANPCFTCVHNYVCICKGAVPGPPYMTLCVSIIDWREESCLVV